MATDKQNDAQTQVAPPPTPEQEKEFPLPDGIGLSLEQIRVLLAKTFMTNPPPKDDAILMVATIFNAYLSEIAKLHARHSAGLADLMAEKTDGYVKNIQTSVDALAGQLSSSSMKGFRAIFAEQTEWLRSFRVSLVFLTAIVGLSALVNVAAFVLLALRMR
jgi:hypothetical protein